MARKAFTEHPEFHAAGSAANAGFRQAMFSMGLGDADMWPFDASTNRIVDDLTKLLLRALDAKREKAAA